MVTFERPMPVKTPTTAPFWDALAQHRIVIQYSPSSDAYVFYPRVRAPRTLADAPQSYIRQLALYRAVLAKLYPELPIRAALLWTETPELMEVPASALDAQLDLIAAH